LIREDRKRLKGREAAGSGEEDGRGGRGMTGWKALTGNSNSGVWILGEMAMAAMGGAHRPGRECSDQRWTTVIASVAVTGEEEVGGGGLGFRWQG
jgi:hypothetical protein